MVCVVAPSYSGRFRFFLRTWWVCVSRELLLDRIAEEVTQEEEYVEAVQGTGALADQVLASFGEQPQDLGVAFRTILGFD